ncbi:MAG TPA: SRPBCC domain-containing protein, partial [Polyangiaceae bacterium]
MNEQLKIVREYDATLEAVWEMWTTEAGIESWWGPDGFAVEVRKLDLRSQGELHYAMIAKAPEMVAFMQREGMRVTQECRITFTEVVPPRRLAYVHRV